MSGPLASQDPGTQKRRSTRIVQAVPIVVTGVDALGQPFKERTTTVGVNCHGCKYQSKHYVPKGMVITLEIPRPSPASPRNLKGRVVWVQRPRTVRELFQIGIEFETAGNVWGIAFPPEDWFAYPGEEAASPAAEPSAAAPNIFEPLQSGGGKSSAHPTSAPAGAASGSSRESGIHVVGEPAKADSPEAQATLARHFSRLVTEAKEALDRSAREGVQGAMGEEMAIARQQLDAHLHEAVQRAVKSSMEQASEAQASKVLRETAERTAAMVEEARKASQVHGADLDLKVRHAVEQAISRSAEQTARQAAEQATNQALTQAVEEAVEHALAGRERSVGLAGAFPSPEAAEKQLEEWRSTLEQTAQDVRLRTIEQSRAEAAAASRRWQEEFEVALSGATHQMSETLSQVSRAAVAQAEQDIAARTVSLRNSLDETVAGARTAIQELTSRVAEERDQAHQTQTQLRGSAEWAVEQARQRFDGILKAQLQEIGQKADEAVAERAGQLQPILQDSARKVLEHFSGELDRSLNAKLDQVRQASEEAARIEASIQQRAQEAADAQIERLRQLAEQQPARAEEAWRAALDRASEEIEQRNTETQHQTFEALQKAADWYQKKAQTTMQAALERTLGQSTAALRDRAAEMSSMAASELDHYRRSYVEHTTAEIEDTASEVGARERSKLTEAADMAAASFHDRLQRMTSEGLQNMEEAARERIQSALDQHILEGIEQARVHLQSQLAPLIEAWEERREEERRAWTEHLQKSAEQSMEQYKARLENATNSWLLASATTLGQHSQTVLDTLARSAEKRLRETCADVLAGMGDTLKDRLLGISTDFSTDEEDPPAPPRKK